MSYLTSQISPDQLTNIHQISQRFVKHYYLKDTQNMIKIFDQILQLQDKFSFVFFKFIRDDMRNIGKLEGMNNYLTIQKHEISRQLLGSFGFKTPISYNFPHILLLFNHAIKHHELYPMTLTEASKYFERNFESALNKFGECIRHNLLYAFFSDSGFKEHKRSFICAVYKKDESFVRFMLKHFRAQLSNSFLFSITKKIKNNKEYTSILNIIEQSLPSSQKVLNNLEPNNEYQQFANSILSSPQPKQLKALTYHAKKRNIPKQIGPITAFSDDEYRFKSGSSSSSPKLLEDDEDSSPEKVSPKLITSQPFYSNNNDAAKIIYKLQN